MFVLDHLAEQGMRDEAKSPTTEEMRNLAARSVFFDVRGWLSLFNRNYDNTPAGVDTCAGPAVHLPFERCWFEIGENGPTVPHALGYKVALAARDAGAVLKATVLQAKTGQVRAIMDLVIPQNKEILSGKDVDAGFAAVPPAAIDHVNYDVGHLGISCLYALLRMLDCKKQVRLSTESTIRERTRRRCGICVGTGFHVLHLRPRSKDAEIELRERDDDPQHRPLPLFLVRGHYQTYTAEAPLFGKHVGRWWWAPQTRGDADNGIVLKSYRSDETGLAPSTAGRDLDRRAPSVGRPRPGVSGQGESQ